MRTIYARERLTKSIFLAGPTPRSPDVEGWRENALNYISRVGFNGTVFVPEPRTCDDWSDETYDAQVTWEWEALKQASVVIFWIPRNLETLPAFTTNIEVGLMINTSTTLIGFPEDAPKNKYIRRLANRYNVPVFNNLEDLLDNAISLAEAPFSKP